MAEPVLACGFEERDRERIVALLREYEAGTGVSLCFQSFEAELAGLPGDYAPPRGALVLARQAGGSGAAGLRRAAARAGLARLVRDEAPLRAAGAGAAPGSAASWRSPPWRRRAGSATGAYASIRCPA